MIQLKDDVRSLLDLMADTYIAVRCCCSQQQQQTTTTYTYTHDSPSVDATQVPPLKQYPGGQPTEMIIKTIVL